MRLTEDMGRTAVCPYQKNQPNYLTSKEIKVFYRVPLLTKREHGNLLN